MNVDIEVWAIYDEETLALCQLAALNAWDKVAESGYNLNHFLKLCKAEREPSLTICKGRLQLCKGVYQIHQQERQ